MKFQPKIGILHFIGIGGIGMSGIAEVLFNLGYQVQGSDLTENNNVKRLRKLGINVFTCQKACNIDKASIIVVSSAIQKDNPELMAAHQKKLMIVKRSEMLAELMRFKSSIAVAGSHGKTTTTSLIAALFDQSHLDPTVINGGIINSYDTNGRLGSGDWIVVESDESDGSFLHLNSTIAVVTNIDPEHMGYYKTFENLINSFKEFIVKIPFYSFAVLCIDCPVIRQIMTNIHERRFVTYGTNPQADFYLSDYKPYLKGCLFTLTIQKKDQNIHITLKDIFLPMIGLHNALNATAALAIAYELGIDMEIISQGFHQFKGIKRRFTKIYAFNNIEIYDDYAHHPTEIKAVLLAARQQTKGKIIAVIQPHRYTRLQELFEEFADCYENANHVFITPIYEAGEKPIDNISQQTLVKRAYAKGHKHVKALSCQEDLPDLLIQLIQPGDMIIFMGAGDITYWAPKIAEKTALLFNKRSF